MIAYFFDAIEEYFNYNILTEFFSISGVACSALIVKYLFSRKG